ncbi:MAG: ribonuclease E inhibitor RraB [Balneolaceae bacterium]
MSPFIRDHNREIFKLINHLDSEPESARPIAFWFYSKNDKRICNLAAHLHENGYRIIRCQKSIQNKFLCIAEKVMVPKFELLNKLCIDMQIIAEKMEVEFDGWGTEIDLSSTD